MPAKQSQSLSAFLGCRGAGPPTVGTDAYLLPVLPEVTGQGHWLEKPRERLLLQELSTDFPGVIQACPGP